MDRLHSVTNEADIFPEYQNTPIGKLIEYHNLRKKAEWFDNAELLIGMCMDHRKHLHIPKNFAYIIRDGGANIRHSAFKISYAISVGGIKHIALIGHNNCGMVNLESKKQKFIHGLVENAGWDEESAEEHFSKQAPLFEIGNEIEFTIKQAQQLRQSYPKIQIAPMLYKVEDDMIYLISEK